MSDEIPSISRSWDLPDDDRAAVLMEQATLPSDLVNPADALGDERWQAMVDEDLLGMGGNALADFRYGWDWGMTPAQRASALADVAHLSRDPYGHDPFERAREALISDVAAYAQGSRIVLASQL